MATDTFIAVCTGDGVCLYLGTSDPPNFAALDTSVASTTGGNLYIRSGGAWSKTGGGGGGGGATGSIAATPNLLKGDNHGNAIAATSNTDFQAPLSIPVSGQTTLTGLSALTVVAGANVTLLTDNSAKTLTIAAATGGTGSGTVTTISFTGGIVSIANPTTTPALTVAGTSGGIPYFASSSTWASSGALTAHAIVLGGGAGAAPTALTTGTSGQVLTSGGTSAPTWGSPTVPAAANTGDMLFVSSGATAVDDPNLTYNSSTHVLTVAGGVVSNGSQGILKLPPTTVASLPGSPTQGMHAVVTDATSPTFLGVVTGGGSVVCPVLYNGTAWVAY